MSEHNRNERISVHPKSADFRCAQEPPKFMIHIY